MAKRSEMSDVAFGAKLCRAYDAAAEAAESNASPNHPRHAVNAWLAAARGSPVSEADNDDAPGAMDSAPRGRPSREVQIAIDQTSMQPAEIRLDMARANLRNQGPRDLAALTHELEVYLRPKPRGARVEIQGIERLRK